MAKKCGSCHKKRMANRESATASISPPAEVQPITGGAAPGKAPNSVQSAVRVFSGVYTKIYPTNVAAPRAAANALPTQRRYATPATEITAEQMKASAGKSG